jgi:xylulokinase
VTPPPVNDSQPTRYQVTNVDEEIEFWKRSTMPPAVVGVDIGTSSSKGVLVTLDGHLLRSCVVEHAVDRLGPGFAEMDAKIWWDELVTICRELLSAETVEVVAVGVSGMGPCVLLTDEADEPLRPAILYGIDTRAGRQIEQLNDRYGAEQILRRCGSALSSQAAGAKIAWIADEEPAVFARARRLYMPSSWLARRLTGEYVLDHHSASQCTPLYDVDALDWYQPWAEEIAPGIDLPPLRWPGDAAGTVTMKARATTGLPADIPVITGTIDAWAEALSVGAQGVGDLMLMYGTTMFLIHTVPHRLTSPALWGTIGALPGTHNLAGGMATSGAITSWLRDLFGSVSYADLLELADRSGVGANGLLLLPYFAGERTPIMDPLARGVIAGLTILHTRGDLYRAALEATGYGVRHNIEAIESAGGDIKRIVAVGGGTKGSLWTQVVSDITGRSQELRQQSIGASYGSALLAAQLVSDASVDLWNPVQQVLTPRSDAAAAYDGLYALYRQLYTASADVAHALAARQQRPRTANALNMPATSGVN